MAAVVGEQTANLWLGVATLVIFVCYIQELSTSTMDVRGKETTNKMWFFWNSPTKLLSEILDALMGTQDAWHEGPNILRGKDNSVCVGGAGTKKDVF